MRAETPCFRPLTPSCERSICSGSTNIVISCAKSDTVTRVLAKVLPPLDPKFVRAILLRPSLKTDNPRYSSYGSDDLNFMSATFVRACKETPEIASSDDRRETPAKTIVNGFEAVISESDVTKISLLKH
jgi:hypothetical protein